MTTPPEPDFALLVTIAARAVSDRLVAAHAAAGNGQVRPPHGFVIRALGDGGMTLTELASQLGVSKQAAQKLVDDMEARGLVERVASATDRRAKLLRLTADGQAVRATSLAESRRMESELRRSLGAETADAMRRALERFVERNGGLEDTRAGRARPVW
jgi:DNA-binding MarR family transcriptional regulator